VAESAFLTAEISHRIGSFHLEAHFHLSAPWTVLFGPSGAGKSTVLRVLAGLVAPSEGRILMGNRVLLDTRSGLTVAPGHRGIGFLTQQPALFPHMSVRRNIAFGLHQLAREEREQRLKEMLALFRIGPLAERMPSELSGGEYQRAALARSLAPRPELLLLDEPFSGLDAELKASILDDLSAWLRKSHTPLLYVSHDLVEAYQTNAEVIVLENGRIETQGPVHEVLAPKREQLLQQIGAR
jgi:ABC-type sulfate/molybdate transport systems ATPase subunit